MNLLTGFSAAVAAGALRGFAQATDGRSFWFPDRVDSQQTVSQRARAPDQGTPRAPGIGTAG
ncbi:hypothetical protein [Demequina sediminis]|uniref:hypothetical protein n=1 Tax=Demequina sediminis TaxID=1930058 RepID=UPI0031E7E56C